MHLSLLFLFYYYLLNNHVLGSALPLFIFISKHFFHLYKKLQLHLCLVLNYVVPLYRLQCPQYVVKQDGLVRHT